MKKLLLLILVSGFVFGCSCNDNKRGRQADAEQREVNTANTPNNRYTVDYVGTYKGTLPCADCMGIETTLEIKDNGQYRLHTKYLGGREDRKDIEKTVEGNFSWNNTGKIITLNGVADGPDKYLLSDGMLFQLDRNGSRITGELADKYILKK